VPALLTGAPAYVHAGPSTTPSSAPPAGRGGAPVAEAGEQLAAGHLDRGERVVERQLDLAGDAPVDA